MIHLCHCTDCPYCDKETEHCLKPIIVVNRFGLCSFLFDNNGQQKQNIIITDEITKFNYINVELVEVKEEEICEPTASTAELPSD